MKTKCKDLICICREVNARTGEIAVYKTDGKITSDDLFILKYRACFNHELRYFVTTEDYYLEHHKEITDNLRQGEPETCDGLVEID